MGFLGEVCLDFCVEVCSSIMNVKNSFGFRFISFHIIRLHFWNSGVEEKVCIGCVTGLGDNFSSFWDGDVLSVFNFCYLFFFSQSLESSGCFPLQFVHFSH